MNNEEHRPVLVDTSVWVQFFNLPNSQERAHVDGLILRKAAAITGIILAEVLQGSRSRGHLEELIDMMKGLLYLETSNETWQKAGELAFELKVRGETIPLTDAAIGAVALEHGCELYTRDQHFQRIPGLRLYEAEAA